jgi:hypothetical protein
MLQAILLGIFMTVALDSIIVNEVRLKEEHAADADVLSSLERNGDCPSVVRAVGVRFVGLKPYIYGLAQAANSLGFTIIQIVEMPSGEEAIDLSLQSDTQKSSIEGLTLSALRMERHFMLRYDGWGTVAMRCDP